MMTAGQRIVMALSPAVLTAMISLSDASRPKTIVTAKSIETGTVYGRVPGMTYGTSIMMSRGARPSLTASAMIRNRTKTNVMVSSASANARTISPMT